MKRLPKGYGSVYKLSGKRRRPYTARVMAGKTSDGKPIFEYLGYFEDKAAALKVLSNYNYNPYNTELSNATIDDIWKIFQQRRFDKVSDSAVTVYKAAYSHLYPIHKNISKT